MTTSVVPSPDEMRSRRAQMFPALTPAQVARVARVAKEREFAAGEVLFDEGERDVALNVILEGAVEIVHVHEDREEQITVHGPREFTGEISLLANRRALVRGRATEPTRVLRLEPRGLQTLLQTDSELSEVFMRAFILRRMGLFASEFGDVIVIGSRHSAATLRIQEFLTRNAHPHRYVDVDRSPDVQSCLDNLHLTVSDIPIVVCRGEKVLRNPTNAELADCLGFNAALNPESVRDVVVVGAGPAGLAAAVYASSEGLDTLVIEATAPGGQAGSSSKIENYLGFPTGISGQALAQRALTQAEKFGAAFAVARGVTRLHCDDGCLAVELDGGEVVRTRSVVIATGAEYGKLDVPNLARFEGTGVYYGATFIEAQRCESDEVIVIGGGNSAGQAATFLSGSSRHVHILVRGAGLAATMSRYLIRRIEETPNITLHAHTRIVGLAGDTSLEEVTWLNDATGERTTSPIRHVFSMIGARPNTEWLKGCLKLDEKGFVLTGVDVQAHLNGERPRFPFETSRAKVFAVGDVRANSVKRVASGVGEGSVCIQAVHRALAE
ncbi:MAG TPA: FAD-dependent oxidoreductase [Polyangiaceae bacterium]|nr:FAD-dependent oxidoreductase [Polyangiaceae bacterium]